MSDIFGSLSDLTSYFIPDAQDENPKPSIDPTGEIVNTDNINTFRKRIQEYNTTVNPVEPSPKYTVVKPSPKILKAIPHVNPI